MNTVENPDFNFVVGGSLLPNAMCYVERQADREFYEGLQNGEICYVFNSRQTGKSSLRNRTAQRLEEEDYICVTIDLTTIGTALSLEQWYATLIINIAKNFELEFELSSWWHERELLSPVNKLSEFIEKVLLTQVKQKIIIFIDEIDGVLSLKFSADDFFAFIRSCYDRRANQPEYNSLTFALLGVATPSDLIKDVKKTPFNIGRAIELNGFQLEESQILSQGFTNNVENPEAVLQRILHWTGGQPFLTQKLCQLVLDNFSPSSPIVFGTETEKIDNLVRSQIIENWQTKDDPQHLKTIRDRLLRKDNEPRIFRLLGLYKQMLLQGEIEADNSNEQTELRLSGLVVLKNGKLIVSNPIYQNIFNQEFVDSELDKLRPKNYAKSLHNWSEAGCKNKYLLQEKELFEAQQWAEGKSLSDEDYQFLNASQERRANKSSLFARYAVGGFITLAVLSLSGGIYASQGICKPNQISSKETFIPSCITAFSSGENRLFLEGIRNIDFDFGIEAFNSENYRKAVTHFEAAIKSSPSDPEAQIYLNNAKARSNNFKPFVIAVVIPVSNNTGTAKNLLRGIAQAQTEFNEDQKKKSQPLLEVLIANDEDDSNIAKKIASKIIKNKKIIAVIGHDSSETTKEALKQYEKDNNLAVISSTATSTQLSGTNFFRVPSSNKFYGSRLAQYIKKTIELEEVAIFYNSNSTYSNSFKQAFEKEFDGTIKNIDLTENKNWKEEIKRLVHEENFKAAVLLPSTTTTSRAIAIARANAELLAGERLQLLGGDTLYANDILRQGGEAFDGLRLVIPWHDDTDYTDKAKGRWGKNVGWRMATSYDAAQVITKALSSLSEGATREDVLEKLNEFKTSEYLREDETSGEQLCFDRDGNSNRYARIRKVENGTLIKIEGEEDQPAKSCPLNESK